MQYQLLSRFGFFVTGSLAMACSGSDGPGGMDGPGATGTGGSYSVGSGGDAAEGSGGVGPVGTGGADPTGSGGMSPEGSGGTLPEGTGGTSVEGTGGQGTGGDGTGGSNGGGLKNAPVLSPGCGKAAGLTTGKKTIMSSGTQRQYIIDVPENYDPNKPYRLFYASHGLGGMAEHVADWWNYFGLKTQAEAANERAIFIAPQAINSWNESDHALFDNVTDLAKESLCVGFQSNPGSSSRSSNPLRQAARGQ